MTNYTHKELKQNQDNDKLCFLILSIFLYLIGILFSILLVFLIIAAAKRHVSGMGYGGFLVGNIFYAANHFYHKWKSDEKY